MKLKEILGEKEIVSSGDCKTKLDGDCENCNWVKGDYSILVLEHEKKDCYECITDCGYFSSMIVTNKV